MKIETDEILIIFGNGAGHDTIERYHGARTKKAIQNKLSRERCKGYFKVEAWIQLNPAFFGRLTKNLKEIDKYGVIDAVSIKDNPAAVLAHKGARK